MADDSNSTFVPDRSNLVTHPREQLRQLREKLAQAAQQIIDALDAIDGDGDLEPSLALTAAGTSLGNLYNSDLLASDGAFDELEHDTSDLEDTEPLELNGDEQDASICEDEHRPLGFMGTAYVQNDGYLY